MSLPPLYKTTGYVRTLTQLRGHMTELQRQLGTGLRATTNAGLGVKRTSALALRARGAQIEGYQRTADTVSVRLSVIDKALTRFDTIAQDMRGALVQQRYEPSADGQTIAQRTAKLGLEDTLSLLNRNIDGRHLFSGRASDTPATESLETMLEGDGTRQGLKTLIGERKSADLGPVDGSGNRFGRVGSSVTGDDLTLAEDGVHPFGFKLQGLTTSIIGLSNPPVTGGPVPAPGVSTPRQVVLDLAGNQPVPGDTVRLRLGMPDGTSTSIELTATLDTPAAKGFFTIGANSDATANNLKSALDKALVLRAEGELAAASAHATATDFFAATPGNPPSRVGGPPYETATSYAPGSATDTVVWYRGEHGADPARKTALASADDGLHVGYGVRATEPGIATLVANLAVLATETFSPTDPNSQARHDALMQRGLGGLYFEGKQSPHDIRVEIGHASVVLDHAKKRHVEEKAFITDLRSGIESVDQNAVAVELLTLQTRLQASYEATAMISQMSLLKYL
jgi:flagellar hook-associated protein 3 FlgL